MSLKIPAGVETGNRLKINGEGEVGIQGGRPATCTWSSRSKNTRFLSAKDRM